MEDHRDKPTAVIVGSVINDRYEVLSLLGRGGMSTVYRVRDRNLDGQEIALKLLKTSLLEDKGMRERFRREAIISRSLDHPNIVRVFDFDCTYSGEYFITMELVRGHPLSRTIRKSESGIPLDELAPSLKQILAALTSAHNLSVVHRDLKPANILQTEHGRIKVTDFGLARAAGFDTSLSTTGECLGTPSYMSPEQIRGEELDGRCDLYSFGILAYEAATGELPFPGDTWYTVAEQHLRSPVPEMPTSIPEWYRRMVSKCLAKFPADRFNSAEEISTYIDYHSDFATDPNHPLAQTVAKERRAAFGLSFIAVMLACCLIFVVGFSRGGQPSPTSERPSLTPPTPFLPLETRVEDSPDNLLEEILSSLPHQSTHERRFEKSSRRKRRRSEQQEPEEQQQEQTKNSRPEASLLCRRGGQSIRTNEVPEGKNWQCSPLDPRTGLVMEPQGRQPINKDGQQVAQQPRPPKFGFRGFRGK